MNIIKTRFKEFFSLWKNYSFIYACYNILWWVCFYTRLPYCNKISTFAINKKTKWLNNYFNSNYNDIIEKHKENETVEVTASKVRIWVFWGQGEEKMPPLIEACYKQLTHYNENINLVTIENVNKYIELPGVIFEKANAGKISWAHFSDIVRNTLLARYGGLWLDATVWVRGKIPFDKLSQLDIFSANGEVPSTSRSVKFWTSFEYNWSTWCMWSKHANNQLFSFVSAMLIAIGEREKQWPDYVIQDYLIYYAYKNLPGIANMLEESKNITSQSEFNATRNSSFVLTAAITLLLIIISSEFMHYRLQQYYNQIHL
jgi:hypothetical protein